MEQERPAPGYGGSPTPPRCGEPHVVSFATWTSPSTAGRTRTHCGSATPPRARAAVDGALAAGVAVPDVYLGILQPALYAVGHEWAAGELDVAREHYATAVTLTVLGALGPRMRSAPKDGRLAVVSGSPEERHAVGVQMVADFLEGDGWEVLNLGASTPARDLARLVDAEQPDVVALSDLDPGRPPGHGGGGGGAAALRPRPLVVLGGQLWAGEARREAEALGADLVLDGPLELVAHLRERFPPLGPDEEERG